MMKMVNNSVEHLLKLFFRDSVGGYNAVRYA